MKNNGFISIVVLIAVFVMATIGVIVWVRGSDKAEVTVKNEGGFVENVNEENSDLGKPVPFAEMTVPYLRSRSYSSAVGELNLESQRPNYTSYLTSYDSDGLKINAQLTIPKGQAPTGGWPGVVFVHGYIAPTVYTTLGKYVDYVDYLARNGLMVFKIDLRGHGQSEGEPGGAYYSSDYVIDTLNAYSALSKVEGINPAKVGLWGHSMAGNVVMRSVAAKPDIPVAVIWAGAGYTYTDLREYGLNDNSYRPPTNQSNRQRRRTELFNTYGEFNNNSEFWKTVAPTNYLSDIKTAIQLNHAIDDNVVNIEYSRNLDSLLGQTGIRHELHEFTNGGHNISGSSFGQAMRNTVRFLVEY